MNTAPTSYNTRTHPDNGLGTVSTSRTKIILSAQFLTKTQKINLVRERRWGSTIADCRV
jgi:hypothetical protein